MNSIIAKSSTIKVVDGTKLYYSQDIPNEKKAIVIIVHGLCEHSGRYEYVKEQLIGFGYGVYRFDNRGHGKSGGERGHIENFENFITDLDAIVELAAIENPDTPIFVLGHSMGGFITAAYGIRYKDKLKGQILSGAATLQPKEVEGIKGSIYRVMGKIAPKKMIENNLATKVSRDPKVVKKYEEDPLNIEGATIKFYVEFLLKGVKWLNDHIKEYTYPCLILHGGDDKIVDKEASMHFYKAISSKDKGLKIYDDLYHEIMNEKEKDVVLEDIHQWIEERIKAS